MNKTRLWILLETLKTADWRQKIAAADEIVRLHTNEKSDGTKTIVEELVKLLKAAMGDVRNAAALALMEIGDDSAALPLLQAIEDEENFSDRSTLIYALTHFDCSKYFSRVFALALTNRTDVQSSAQNILFEQKFNLVKRERDEALEMLEGVKEAIPEQDYGRLRQYLNSIS